jgi:hypothetical protein
MNGAIRTYGSARDRSYGQEKPASMIALLLHFGRFSRRFENWFDQRFGWFFTNGMKAPRSAEDDAAV